FKSAVSTDSTTRPPYTPFPDGGSLLVQQRWAAAQAARAFPRRAGWPRLGRSRRSGGGPAMPDSVHSRPEETEGTVFPPGCAFIDGRYTSMDQAKIPVLDWGFLRSDATYDVVHVW